MDTPRPSPHTNRTRRVPQVRFLDAHPGVAAVGAAAAIADLSAPPARPRRIAAQPICARLVRYRLALSCCLIHPTVTVRRDALLRAGGYSPFAAPHAEDYSLWLRLAGLGGPLRAAPLQLCNLPDVLVALGKHDRRARRAPAARPPRAVLPCRSPRRAATAQKRVAGARSGAGGELCRGGAGRDPGDAAADACQAAGGRDLPRRRDPRRGTIHASRDCGLWGPTD